MRRVRTVPKPKPGTDNCISLTWKRQIEASAQQFKARFTNYSQIPKQAQFHHHFMGTWGLLEVEKSPGKWFRTSRVTSAFGRDAPETQKSHWHSFFQSLNRIPTSEPSHQQAVLWFCFVWLQKNCYSLFQLLSEFFLGLFHMSLVYSVWRGESTFLKVSIWILSSPLQMCMNSKRIHTP
jgi:hypothetical protein